MVLKPLEFADCVTDSPWFRANLREHELALERSYKSIKLLESQSKELISAGQKLQTAQRNFAKTLQELKLETVGTNETEDERIIANSLKEYSKLILQLEDQRSHILQETEKNFIGPFRKFRIECIGNAIQHERKKYEKSSYKFYQTLEKHLHLSTNKRNDFKEADIALEAEQRQFYRASLDYVCVLQSVQERMKFEFVENLSSFLYSLLTFYHVGHVIHEDFKPYLDHVKYRVQKAKESYFATELETEEFRKKMLRLNSMSHPMEMCAGRVAIKQGYLYLCEKKNLVTTWTKYYCVYQKETRMFAIVPVTQTLIKDIKEAFCQSISFKLKSCIRRASDTIDKRFCFDIISDNDDVLTFQALSDEDRRCWLNALDGKEPFYSPTSGPCKPMQTSLDNNSYKFVATLLERIEQNCINEQGLYRNCGINSKVQRLLQTALTANGANTDFTSSTDMNDYSEWDAKTMTSAVKTFLRNLPEPLMTYALHGQFLSASKLDSAKERVEHIHYYVHQLPNENFRMLKLLMHHLKRVAECASQNLMTACNLAVCFGPCVLRAEEETVAAIMDIKFYNLVVEVLIDNCDQIFEGEPKTFIASPPSKPPHSCTRRSFDCCTETFSPKNVLQASANVDAKVPADQTNDDVLPHDGVRVSSSSVSSSVSNGEENIIEESRTGSIGEFLDQLENVNSFANSRGSASRTCVKYPRPYTSSKRRLFLNPKLTIPNKAPPNRPHSPVSRTVSSSGLQASNRVRTMYECVADCRCQLSFMPGQILTNVSKSKEPGWLVGTLNGKPGLVPENFVEPLP
ncbi:Rho GTPase-activating protein 10 [Trichinella pseudospiralis]|uniref:Rho GTPase-activating protein 10 n=1 Tax=Trichinella pseudospiralis TaxID=6337 RepID=A0A0V1JSP2_TRIPS|nr:Rho GTPase-activating protein 10 [Trichinella pseudospiralis]KRZ37980.1 Rho GTPase-activating protein 10 [Trichinella pseudospiralis]